MIWNLINMLLGIWLVHVAVLNLAFVQVTGWRLPVFGVIIIVLAALARPADFLKWTSSTNACLGVALLILAVLKHYALANDVLMFWVVFWVGMLVAILALWSVLYRRASPPATAGEAPAMTAEGH